MGHDDEIGFLVFFQKTLAHQTARIVIIGSDGTVRKAVFLQIRVHHHDKNALFFCFFQYLRQAFPVHGSHHKNVDAHMQHLVDLLDLPVHTEGRIPQNKPVSFDLHPAADLLIQNLVEFIVHGHVADADKVAVFLLF